MTSPAYSQNENTRFVELNRGFFPLSEKDQREENAAKSYLRESQEQTLDWEKLLRRRLVILLGEPGSGKTAELKQKASSLSKAGQYAFFCRLDELVQTPLATVIGLDAERSFNSWKASRLPATFFLDSVDESKLLKASDFHTALRRFRDAIGQAQLPRVRLVLSSRISEWHPETDGAEVCAMFGIPHPDTGKSNKDEEADDSPLVVQIAPLNREQVELFAQSRQIDRLASFLEALDGAHAWEFARRPLDVIALAGMWSQRGQIGTLTELIEFDLGEKLREVRQRSGDLLTASEARAGAEALAAATAFGQSQSIKVPDQAFALADAIDGRAAVPDTFTDDKYHMLLTRPLFDGASYGRIRFHHRRVREYLAAQWVLRRMEQGCSLDELESLFFVGSGDKRVLRASLAPVAPWLCAGTTPWNQAMRQWVLEAAPSLHFLYGDPQALSLRYKRAVLQSLLDRNKGRHYTWLKVDEEALARLGSAELAQDISRIMLAEDTPKDVREAMLMIVSRSKLSECADAALQILADENAPRGLKNYASIALRDCALPEHKRRWAEIVSNAKELAPSVAHMAVEELLPDFLTDQAAIDVLMKVRKTRHDLQVLPRYLTKKLQEALNPDRCGSLLAALIQRLREEPHFMAQEGSLPISQRFGAYRALLAPIMLKLFSKPLLDDEEVVSASLGMWMVYDMRSNSSIDQEESPSLEAACSRHPAVRRRLLWEKVKAARDDGCANHRYWNSIFGNNDVIMQSAESDAAWLVADITERPDPQERSLALRLVLERWLQSGRPKQLLREIRAASSGQPELRDELNRVVRSVHFQRVNRWWRRAALQRIGRKRWWLEHWARIRSFYIGARNRTYVALRMRPLSQGRKDRLLIQILDRAQHREGRHWSDYDWTAIEKSWGTLPTRAIREGLKGFWRRHTPQLPHEKANPSEVSAAVVLGLTGIQLSWDGGELDFAKVSDPDAALAARYAVNELNDFPTWFPELLSVKRAPTVAVLNACVRGEWNIADEKSNRWEVLQRLAWPGVGEDAEILRTLLELLATGDPPHLEPLRLALTALLRSSGPPVEELRHLAAKRFISLKDEAASLATWFIVWMQLDPAAALDAWDCRLCKLPRADEIMVDVCAGLNGSDSRYGPHRPDRAYLTGTILVRLFLIVIRHVRFTNDLDRANSKGYTPNRRDYAQTFRDSLPRRLAELSEPGAPALLAQLADEPTLAQWRDYMLHLRQTLEERLADAARWSPIDVRNFEREHELGPCSNFDLFQIGSRRFSDISRELKHSDSGLRAQLPESAKERDLRIWLATELTRRRNNRYTVPQEVEIDQEQHPDIRLENPRAGYVSVEVKLADRWSLNILLERLENQLFGQYLRAHDSHYGFFVLGIINANHRWDNPNVGQRLSFEQVIETLEERAKALSAQHGEMKRAKIVALDFRRPIKERP